LFAQLLVLPCAAFSLVYLFEPAQYIAIGLIILSCCPGGATSNFFTLLAKGNVATSICLTLLSGIVSVFSIPWIVNFALDIYLETDDSIFLPVGESMLRIFILIVLPVMIGMGLKHKLKDSVVHRIEPIATKLSFALVVMTMAIVLFHIWELIPALIKDAGLITLLLNLVMMAFGFVAALALQLDERNTRCVVIEIGVQNYLLSVIIALGMLNQPLFAVVPLLYLFIMYITVFSFIGFCRVFRRAHLLPILPKYAALPATNEE
jgi:BASS family bile acid:Na+ symporter